MPSLGRRELLKKGGLSMLGLTAGAALLGSRRMLRAAGRDRPNLLFVLVDDLGWMDLGCYGNKFNETPHIDQLAEQSVRFTNAYASCPVCSPTRASIMSGQYQQRFQVEDFIPGHWRPFEKLTVPENAREMPLEIDTVAEALKPAGYATAKIGKWHLGNSAKQQGFDVDLESRGRRVKNPTQWLTDQSIKFMRSNENRPFFLFLSHHDVHIPLKSSAELVAKYQKKPNTERGVNHPVYAAVLEEVDRSVGRLMQSLEDMGIAEDTVVVFFSDNGGMYRNYLDGGEPVTSNAPLRGEKGTIYEGGIRVPLMVRWPGVSKAGMTCDEPVISNDFYPTFLQAAGASQPKGHVLDGLSLQPLLERPNSSLDREALFWHYPYYHHSTPAGAVRSGDWKLLEFFEDNHLELYNLAEDIGEENNVARQHPAKARELYNRMVQWREEVGARLPTPNPKYDPSRAHEWWSRRAGKRLDEDRVRKRLRTRWPVNLPKSK